jgi:hypothetical protein
MLNLDARLADWLEAYNRLKIARDQLAAADAIAGATDADRCAVQALGDLADCAFAALNVEFQAFKESRSGPALPLGKRRSH